MIQKQKRKTWEWFSKYIRLKYADHQGNCTCYTCGKKYPWKKMQAGHGMGGRTNNILFDERIVRAQCYGCNIRQYGRLDEFGDKLRKEIGEKTYSDILKNKYLTRSYSNAELNEMIEYYKNKAIEIAHKKSLFIDNIQTRKREFSKNSIIIAKMFPERKRSKEILKKIKKT